MRAIDFHVHLPTPDWLDVTMRGYVEAAETYFRSKVARRTLDDPLTSANKCGRRATALARIGMLIEVAIEERGLDGDQPHDLPAGGTSRRLLRRRNAL